MSETVFHGYLGPGQRLLLLKLLEKTGERGLLGFRLEAIEYWYWIADGSVAFGRCLGETRPADETPFAGTTPDETRSAWPTNEPGEPFEFLEHRQGPGVPTDAANEAWRNWYGKTLAAVLREPEPVECLWMARDWQTHPDMVQLPIAEWVLLSLQDAGVRELLSRIVAQKDLIIAHPGSERLGFQEPHDVFTLDATPEQIAAVWNGLWTGARQLQNRPPQPPKPPATEVLDQLLQFYSDAFSILSEYLIEELGELGPAILRKNLAQIASSHPLLLQELDYSESFTIQHWKPRLESLIQTEAVSLPEIGQVLDELLMLNLFTTQNILGNMHYTTLLTTIQTLRRSHLPMTR